MLFNTVHYEKDPIGFVCAFVLFCAILPTQVTIIYSC